MPYQEAGNAPSRHGHACVHLVCDTCGDKRITRAGPWRKNGLAHVCKTVVPATPGATINVAEEISSIHGTLTDMQADSADMAMQLEQTRTELEQALGRIRELELHKQQAIGGPGGASSIPDMRDTPAVKALLAAVAPVEPAEPVGEITYASLMEGVAVDDTERRKAIAEDSHKRAVELAYLLYPQRTPALKAELIQRRAILLKIVERAGQGHPDWRRLSEIITKISKTIRDWDSKFFDLAVQLHEKEPADD